MADYYDTLAADYDWIFDDDALAGGLAINHPAAARLLQRTSHTSAVLDAACGTGVNAAALARRGYRVRAADASSSMAAVAAARFRSERLEIGSRRQACGKSTLTSTMPPTATPSPPSRPSRT